MASEKAVRYVLHHHLCNGKDVEYLAERWSRTYPDDAITTSQAEGFVKEVLRQEEAGVHREHATRKIVAEQEKPVLKVVSKPASKLTLPPKKKEVNKAPVKKKAVSKKKKGGK